MAAPQNCQAQKRMAAGSELTHLNCLSRKAGQALLKVQRSWLLIDLSAVSTYTERHDLRTVPQLCATISGQLLSKANKHKSAQTDFPNTCQTETKFLLVWFITTRCLALSAGSGCRALHLPAQSRQHLPTVCHQVYRRRLRLLRMLGSLLCQENESVRHFRQSALHFCCHLRPALQHDLDLQDRSCLLYWCRHDSEMRVK